MNELNKKIPVQFENLDQIDSRFQKVKIWLMHLGRNYNQSIFTREAVLNAVDSLGYTPILGFVEEGRLGDKDFRGHESELVVENGEYKIKYIGQAFGVIPKDCNPRFERKVGDYGEELEYLVVDGLLWTRFEDAIDILNEQNSVGQSMELDGDYDGYYNENGEFVFTRFKFNGACMLGQDVPPAMQKASVDKVMFSLDSIKKEVSERLEQYYLTHGEFSKEVEDLEKELEVQEVQEVQEVEVQEVVEEQEAEKVEVQETPEVQEVQEVQEVSEPVAEPSFADKDEEEEAKDEETDEEVKEDEKDEEEEKDFSLEQPQFAELQGKVAELTSEVQKLTAENFELKEFKKLVLAKEHEANVEDLFSRFAKLDAEEVADIRENMHNFSVQEIEVKLFERLGRKMANFSQSKTKEDTKVKVNIGVLPTEGKKSSYGHLFAKHGVKAHK